MRDDKPTGRADGDRQVERDEEAMTLKLKMTEIKEMKPKINVFGVGGAGGNAVNNMIRSGLQG